MPSQPNSILTIPCPTLSDVVLIQCHLDFATLLLVDLVVGSLPHQVGVGVEFEGEPVPVKHGIGVLLATNVVKLPLVRDE